VLEELSIAAPCRASWEQMVGDDHVRFCGQCEKNVYNLSSLPREEAEALLVAKEGKMCVRLYRRADGTVLTNDCPVGVKKRRRRRAAFATMAGSLMAAAAAVGLESKATMGDPMPATMGSAVVMQGDLTSPPATVATTPTGDPPGGQWIAGGIGPQVQKETPKAKAKAAVKKPTPSPAPFMGAVDLGE
jgi:hypothetical protein